MVISNGKVEFYCSGVCKKQRNKETNKKNANQSLLTSDTQARSGPFLSSPCRNSASEIQNDRSGPFPLPFGIKFAPIFDK